MQKLWKKVQLEYFIFRPAGFLFFEVQVCYTPELKAIALDCIERFGTEQ